VDFATICKDLCISIVSVPPVRCYAVPCSEVLDTVKTQRVRLDHNIHTASQLEIMTSRKPRVVIFLAMLATLIGEKLVAHGRNIVMTIAVSSIAAELAENLRFYEYRKR
jgi:hypothetical protein